MKKMKADAFSNKPKTVSQAMGRSVYVKLVAFVDELRDVLRASEETIGKRNSSDLCRLLDLLQDQLADRVIDLDQQQALSSLMINMQAQCDGWFIGTNTTDAAVCQTFDAFSQALRNAAQALEAKSTDVSRN